MYMGGSGDHALAPVHAHINLLGFTLMTVFGLAYRLIPTLNDGMLGKAHFWLHQVGTFGLLLALFLMMSGRMAEASVGPFMAVLEGIVAVGILCWVANIYRSTR